MAFRDLWQSVSPKLDGRGIQVPTDREVALRTAIDNVTGVEYSTRRAHRHVAHLRREFPEHIWRLRRLPAKPQSRVITYAGPKGRPW